MNIRKNLSPARKAGNLADAAAALRAAERAYRTALAGGDLIGAIRAKELVNSAGVALEVARMAIEGSGQ
ncbi:hypothetical protein [Bradyrhizobium australafricanum]|uniref:hypothetical protein n=1 Tax=Bradyrhizobium australafricanum TaxID=2821406 RepID=UPI001CE37259|nr:hypothetical protein [Bradyrhizobium australafricanum]MCA6099197.1 hypothetical protein [Bradyrhizobium australafricanum]